MWITAGAALLLIVLILFIAAMAWPGEKQEDVHPIEDLEQEEVDPEAIEEGNHFTIGR